MGTERTDAELVSRYLETRKLRYFDELVSRHRQLVLRVALSVLGPALAADAEDVVQESLIKAHDRLASFRGESRFASWLYRVTYNQALDARRSALRRRRWRLESAEMPEAQSARAQPENAGDRLLADERGRAVREALAVVPEPYQSALHSYYWLELPVGEIAEMLDVAPGTVKSYLFRGRARLSRLLSKKGVSG